MVISPVGTSSSTPFLLSVAGFAVVAATNGARCSFSVSADPLQLGPQ